MTHKATDSFDKRLLGVPSNARALAILFLLCSSLLFTCYGCKECCPSIEEFYAEPRIVCPGDEVELNFTVRYYFDGDREEGRCRHENGLTIMRNITTGDVISTETEFIPGEGSNFRSVRGRNRLEVPADTLLRYEISSGQCPVEIREAHIFVADGHDDFIEPTFAYNGDGYPNGEWTFDFSYGYFGAGIRITDIENLTEVPIRLSIDNAPDRPTDMAPREISHETNFNPRCPWTITVTSDEAHGILVQADAILRISFTCG